LLKNYKHKNLKLEHNNLFVTQKKRENIISIGNISNQIGTGNVGVGNSTQPTDKFTPSPTTSNKIAFAPVIIGGVIVSEQIIAAISVAAVAFIKINEPYIKKLMSDAGLAISQSDLVKYLTGQKKIDTSTMPLIKKLVNRMPAPLAGMIKQNILQTATGKPADEPAKIAPQTSVAATGGAMPPEDPNDKAMRERQEKRDQAATKRDRVIEILKNELNLPKRMSPERMRAEGIKETPKQELKRLESEIKKSDKELWTNMTGEIKAYRDGNKWLNNGQSEYSVRVQNSYKNATEVRNQVERDAVGDNCFFRDKFGLKFNLVRASGTRETLRVVNIGEHGTTYTRPLK
jgi:hypothetical protein